MFIITSRKCGYKIYLRCKDFYRDDETFLNSIMTRGTKRGCVTILPSKKYSLYCEFLIS